MTDKVKLTAAQKAEILIDKYNMSKEKFMQTMQKQFKKLFKEFFKQHKTIGAVTWYQYTPYFNDGEPCVFNVYDQWVLTKNSYKAWQKDHGYAEEYHFCYTDWNQKVDGKYPEKYIDDITEKEAEEIYAFIQILSKIPDEIYLGMFGDHAQVIVTRKEIIVNEHKHD